MNKNKQDVIKSACKAFAFSFAIVCGLITGVTPLLMWQATGIWQYVIMYLVFAPLAAALLWAVAE